MTKQAKKLTCGIVMPISGIDEKRNARHFENVKEIIKDAISNIKEYDFNCEIVSYSETNGMIHSEIIKNLYHNDVVICDVSGHNPNVFFELGIRLAVDLPTILIQDDENEEIAFDISPLKHEEYPLDLDYQKIAEFKTKIARVVQKVYEKKIKEGEKFSQYIQKFGGMRIKDISEQDTTVADTLQAILQQTERTAHEVKRLNDDVQHLYRNREYPLRRSVERERILISESEFAHFYNENYDYLLQKLKKSKSMPIRELGNRILIFEELMGYKPTWDELNMELTKEEGVTLKRFIKKILGDMNQELMNII